VPLHLNRAVDKHIEPVQTTLSKVLRAWDGNILAIGYFTASARRLNAAAQKS
jgi:hypothetical protein